MSPRSDSTRNRSQLIGAARRVFATYGVDAPLERIVREAGVGRGTLYRHFPDRESIACALLSERLDELVVTVRESRGGPRRLLHFLGAVSRYLTDTPGLLTLMRTSPTGRHHFAQMQTQIELLIEEVLEADRAENGVRADINTRDVILIIAMMEGVAAIANADARDTQRTLELLTRSVQPGPRSPHGHLSSSAPAGSAR